MPPLRITQTRTMKYVLAIISIAACLLFSSCGSAGLNGSLPVPFTDPPVNVKGNVEVTPLPPKVCIGLDVIPRPETGNDK